MIIAALVHACLDSFLFLFFFLHINAKLIPNAFDHFSWLALR